MISKTEDLISQEQQQERRKQQELLKAEYSRASLDFIVAKQQFDAQVAALPEGSEPPGILLRFSPFTSLTP